MPAKPISRETRMYLAFWRKAYREDREISFSPPSFQAAIAFRMAMYRAIQPYRTGVLHDPDLLQASERWTLWLDKETNTVALRARRSLTVAEQFLADLGMDDEDLMLPHEREQRDRLLSLQAQFQEKAPDLSNPFYSRED